jgi:hypothetical protein
VESVGSGQEAAAEHRPALEKQVLLGYLFLAAGLIFLTVGYVTHRLVAMGVFFNSDTLFPAELYQDLIQRGGSLYDWNLPPPPFFFPDWPIFFVTNALAPNPYWAVAAFFVAQIVLTFFALAWLNRLFLDRGKAFLFAGMSLLSLCYLCMESDAGVSPFRCLALPVQHLGIFVTGLVVLRLAVMAILSPETHVKKAHLFLIFILSSLASLSDALFVMQFCGPLVIASIYLWAKCVVPWRKALSVAASTATGMTCGLVLHGHLRLNVVWYPVYIDIGVLSKNASDIESLFLYTWHTHPSWLALCALVWATLFCMWAFVDKLEEFQRPLSGSAKFLTAFCLASCGLVLASNLILNVTVAVRYFIPVFFFPVFLAPYVTLAIRRSGLRTTAILVCMAGVCAAAINFLASNRPLAFHGDYYPEEIQCMDAAFQKYGLDNGVANYWDAKRTVVLAKTEVNIAQLASNLENYEWFTSKRTFRRFYDFAIIDLAAPPDGMLNEARIKAINGQPRETVLCGEKKILVYPKNGLRLH